MANLKQLHETLESIKQNRKTVKLLFYFVNKDHHQMQSGFFLINEGQSCCISYLNQPNNTAFAEIPFLNFTKVMSLPATMTDLSTQPFPACELDELLNHLNPDNFTKISVPEPEPILEQAAAKPAALSEPRVFYSHIAMQQDVIKLLESLYGSGANKRVEEIAITFSPHQYPTEFLDKCKLQASMMLGAKKADEIFQPIYYKLSHGRSSRH